MAGTDINEMQSLKLKKKFDTQFMIKDLGNLNFFPRTEDMSRRQMELL